MGELDNVLESYSKKRPSEAARTPGRFLFCMKCAGFTRHAVLLDGKEKIIRCRNCGSEQARLTRWSGDDWIDRRYTDNLALTILNVLGEKFVANIFAPPEEENV